MNERENAYGKIGKRHIIIKNTQLASCLVMSSETRYGPNIINTNKTCDTD